ncbi:MAG: glutamate synthase central domain-containing protein, partial [Candidatus Rokuibacteriota bacterium]
CNRRRGFATQFGYRQDDLRLLAALMALQREEPVGSMRTDTPLAVASLREIGAVRTRMEVELGKETRGRYHVKLGRGGLVDVEFLAQALQLVHGAAHPGARRASTTAALAGLARAGALPPVTAAALAGHYRFLRRVSTALRLLGARPPDTLELAGPMPARVGTALGFPSRDAFLAAYRERTTAVRAAYTEVFG